MFFVVVKNVITGIGVIVLAAIAKKRLRALALGTVAVCYSVLLTYHVALFVYLG